MRSSAFDGSANQRKVSVIRVVPGWRVVSKQEIRLSKGKDYREFVDQIVAETPMAAPGNALANWKLRSL